MYYSIAGRDIEREIVPLAQDQGLGIMPWSPLAGGFLSRQVHRDGGKPEGARRADFDFPPVDRDRALRLLDAMRADAEGARSVSVARDRARLAAARSRT